MKPTRPPEPRVRVDARNNTKAAAVAKALANPIRVQLWRLTAKRPRTLREATHALKGSPYREAVFRHLEILVAAGIARKAERYGQVVYGAAETTITFEA